MAQAVWLLAAAGSPEAGAEGASQATAPAEEVTNLRHFVATCLLELGRLTAERLKGGSGRRRSDAYTVRSQSNVCSTPDG